MFIHVSVECFPIWCVQVVNRFINLCMTIHINVIKSPVKKKIAKFATKFFFTQFTCTCIIHFPRLVELDKSLNIYINIVTSQFFTDSFYLYIHANKYI